MMKIDAKYSGKWIATKNEKIIGSGKHLTNLMTKFKNHKDNKKLRFTLIPKGLLAG